MISVERLKTKVKNNYHEFVAGYCAAGTTILVLYPLNKAIFRQIINGISAKDAYKQLKSEGVSMLYRGLFPPLLQRSVSYSVLFGTQHQYYILIRDSLEKLIERKHFIDNHSLIDPIIQGSAGYLAGTTEALLTPFERIQAILQTPKYHDSYKNTFHIFKELRQRYGFRELYRGFVIISLRNSVSNVLWFSLRNPLKKSLPEPTHKAQDVLFNFLSGGILGAFISTVFYPFNFVKSHMQSGIGGPFPGVIRSFKELYAKNPGVVNFYRGAHGNFVRAMLSWGITNSSYEFYLDFFKKNS